MTYEPGTGLCITYALYYASKTDVTVIIAVLSTMVIMLL